MLRTTCPSLQPPKEYLFIQTIRPECAGNERYNSACGPIIIPYPILSWCEGSLFAHACLAKAQQLRGQRSLLEALGDHDQPTGLDVAFPGILDLGERNPLGFDAQFAARCMVHHLLKRLGEHVPRRNAPRS